MIASLYHIYILTVNTWFTKDSNQPIAGKSPDKQNVTVFVLDQEKAILLQRKTCDTKL